MTWFIFMFCFFFQAEDGIRDWSVTGVQTCALPICIVGCHGRMVDYGDGEAAARDVAAAIGGGAIDGRAARSEERRVGKEWRSRWWGDHYKERRGQRR